jgi:hypothetical protein
VMLGLNKYVEEADDLVVRADHHPGVVLIRAHEERQVSRVALFGTLSRAEIDGRPLGSRRFIACAISTTVETSRDDAARTITGRLGERSCRGRHEFLTPFRATGSVVAARVRRLGVMCAAGSDEGPRLRHARFMRTIACRSAASYPSPRRRHTARVPAAVRRACHRS